MIFRSSLIDAKAKAEDKVLKRRKLVADLEAQRDAVTLKRGAAADEALDAGDNEAFERYAQSVAALDKKIELAHEALLHAEREALEAQRAVNKELNDEIVRNLSRILNQRAKAARVLQRGGRLYAQAHKDFLEKNDQLLRLITNNGIRPPGDAFLSPAEVSAAIGRMLLQAAPWNGIGLPQDFLVPGATFFPYQGDCNEWPTFVEEVSTRNQYVLNLVERGPQLTTLPAAVSSSEAAATPSEAQAPQLRAVEPPSEGRVFTAAEAAATLNLKRVNLGDYSK
jgi:hypothetical protein